MGIFNDFNKKEKPVFTGSKFGFGSGSLVLLDLQVLLHSLHQVEMQDTSTRSGYTYTFSLIHHQVV